MSVPTPSKVGIELSVNSKSVSATTGSAAHRVQTGQPARVVVIGRFNGATLPADARSPEDRRTRAVRLTLDQLDEQLQALAPLVQTAVGPVGITSIESMHPDELVRHVPLLSQLMTLRRQLRDPAQFEAAARIVRAWQGVPAEASATPGAPPAAPTATDASDDIARLLGRPPTARPVPAPMDQWVADIVKPHLAPQAPAQSEALIEVVNQALSAALSGLLHDARWQSAESFWRGVDWLLRRVDDDQLAHITLVDLSWAELSEDLRAGQVSAALQAALVVNLDDDDGPVLTHVLVHDQVILDEDAIAALGTLASVVQLSGAQAVANPSLQQFFDRHGALLPDTQVAWDQCRQKAGGSLLMVAPRFVMRQPYGPGSDPLDWLDYREPLAHAQGDAILWGNPGWLCLADELCGGQGTVADLPHVLVDEQDGSGARLVTTEWPLNQTLADLLAQFGVRAVVGHASRPMVQLR